MKLPFALVLLLPLAACAAQPPAPAAVSAPAAPAAATEPAASEGKAAAPPPRQPEARVQDATTAPGSAAGSRASLPAAERATTVGEVPATPATTATPDPAPAAAGMPAAPAANSAIPAATPANPARMPQAAAGPSAALSAGSLLQTILALMLVLALLGALAWAMKRYGPKMSGNSANLRMVGAMNIGGRERIMVVEVGDQWIVVGASPGRVNALATMPKGEATPSTASLAGHTPSAATFADWLKQTIDKRNAK